MSRARTIIEEEVSVWSGDLIYGCASSKTVIEMDITAIEFAKFDADDLKHARDTLISALTQVENEMEDRQLLGRVTRRA